MGDSVEVHSLPACDLCPRDETRKDAVYDGKTKQGPWAYMCDEHFAEYGLGLGTGAGQRLILKGLIR